MASINSSIYQAGDYVYVETSSATPYQIRRIEELKMHAYGNVEAKTTCLYRRSTIPSSLISLADKLQNEERGDACSREGRLRRHLVRQRELFPSRQTETLPVARIRGHCSVSLLSSAERTDNYLDTESSFFYSLLYDPAQRTLVADRGEIRVGPEYQVRPPPSVAPLQAGQPDPARPEPPETLLWSPHRLSDADVDRFLLLARSVGTLARALDGGGRPCQPSLHLSAAAACRDVTRLHALEALHDSGYRLDAALSGLVTDRGLALCQDQLDVWSPAEAQLFEQAIKKCGKAFGDVRRDFLPWKSAAELVEYYYLWKTSDRYLRRRRVKAAGRAQLSRVVLPETDWADRVAGGRTTDGGSGPVRGPACAGCSASRADRWFAWGWRRLCPSCWLHWRRYGGLRRPGASDPDPAEEDPPCPRVATGARSSRRFSAPSCLSRGAADFLMWPPPLLLLARRLCGGQLRLRRLARGPLRPVSPAAVQTECLQLLSELSEPELERLTAGGGPRSARPRRRRWDPAGLLPERAGRSVERPAWLAPAAGESEPPPQPGRLAFPRPPTAPDGSLIYTPVRNRVHLTSSVASIRKRSLEDASPVLRVRRPSISQTPIRRGSSS